ncbi:beta-ketoacyl-ACP synthase II [soil metagenome]
MARKRIAVTGMGIVSPLGRGTDLVWKRLIAGQSGVVGLPPEIANDLPAKIAGLVPDKARDPEGGFDPSDFIPPKDQKKMDRFIQFAIGAADEALAQAGWVPMSARDRERTATIVASGIGGFLAMTHAADTVRERGSRWLSPFTVPAFLANLAAGHISIRHGLKGPLGTPVTACAASVQAIGDAVRLIQTGEADIAVAGGAEACVNTVSLGSFAAARALSTKFNDTPEQASRPFDAARDGFVMGEGAAALVVEDWEHAAARGARPLGEIVGYGTTADAYHMTSGPEDGDGARRAMAIAIEQAGIAATDIGYLNAHATSTPVGDRGELAAILSVFGQNGPAVSSTKSATGHLLGAAGALEAIFTLLALRDGVLPPTLNLIDPDPAAGGIDLIGPEARKADITYALSNGFGFGGVNASVILKKV